MNITSLERNLGAQDGYTIMTTVHFLEYNQIMIMMMMIIIIIIIITNADYGADYQLNPHQNNFHLEDKQKY